MRLCNASGPAPPAERTPPPPQAFGLHNPTDGATAVRSILLWLIGIPIPIIILLLIFHVI
jgi:hypothetical protein